MKCKNCGKLIKVEFNEEFNESHFGEPIHEDGFFACRITGLFPSIAEFSPNDLDRIARHFETLAFHQAHVDA